MQPALQGAGHGQVQVALLLEQLSADQLGAPAGVVAAALEDGLQGGVRGSRPGAVAGCEGVGAQAEAAQEVLHGAQVQLQVRCDGGGVLAALVTGLDDPTDRHGQRAGHGVLLGLLRPVQYIAGDPWRKR